MCQVCNRREKNPMLLSLLQTDSPESAIIFVSEQVSIFYPVKSLYSNYFFVFRYEWLGTLIPYSVINCDIDHFQVLTTPSLCIINESTHQKLLKFRGWLSFQNHLVENSYVSILTPLHRSCRMLHFAGNIFILPLLVFLNVVLFGELRRTSKYHYGNAYVCLLASFQLCINWTCKLPLLEY